VIPGSPRPSVSGPSSGSLGDTVKISYSDQNRDRIESYEKNKIERLGAEAARPHRVTYRKLTRG
jgi:hypothetical protein